MANALAEIAKQTQDGKVYVRVPAYQFQGLHARLALWGLAEELLIPKRSGSGQTRSGSWRPTTKGMQWLSGLITVPAEVHVVAGRVVGLGRSLITWEQAMTSAPTKAKGKARNAIVERGQNLGTQVAQPLRLLDDHGAAPLEHALAAACVQDICHIPSVRQLLQQHLRAHPSAPPLQRGAPGDARLRDLSVRPHDLHDYDHLQLSTKEESDVP